MSGLIIVPVFIFYTVTSFFVLKFLFKKLFPKSNNKKVLSGTLIIILIFPFWDYILANLLTSNNSIIIEYPKTDSKGKYDSFGSIFTAKHIYIDTLENDSKRKEYFKNHNDFFVKHTKDFVELECWSILDSEFKKIIKINFNNEEYPYSFIEKTQARYIQTLPIIKAKSEYFGFSFLEKKVEIIDTKENKVIAYILQKAYSTNSVMDYFRKNILLWMTGTSQRVMATITKEQLLSSYIRTGALKKELFKMEDK